MSTRSFIGFYNQPDAEILGVYHHWDGYPEGIGATLCYVAQIYDDLTILRDVLFEHVSGYSTLNDWDGMPENLIGYDEDDAWRMAHINIDYTQYYALKKERGVGIYYGARPDDELMKLTDVPDSWCEYAYIILPEQRMMIVMNDELHMIGYSDLTKPNLIILEEYCDD